MMNANQSPEQQRVTWRKLLRPFLVGAATGFLTGASMKAVDRLGGGRYHVAPFVVSPPLIALMPVIWRWGGCPVSAAADVMAAYGATGFIGTILGAGVAAAIYYFVWP